MPVSEGMTHAVIKRSHWKLGGCQDTVVYRAGAQLDIAITGLASTRFQSVGYMSICSMKLMYKSIQTAEV